MKKQINKTRYKVLLNRLVVESENYIKVRVFYNNGLLFKVYPIENTLLNKHLLRI